MSAPLNATKMEVYPLADGTFLSINVEKSVFCKKWHHVASFIEKPELFAVLEAERLLPLAVTWCHSTKHVFNEPLSCVGAVPFGCHMQINRRALIGQARYPYISRCVLSS